MMLASVTQPTVTEGKCGVPNNRRLFFPCQKRHQPPRVCAQDDPRWFNGIGLLGKIADAHADGHAELFTWTDPRTLVVNGNVSRRLVPGSVDYSRLRSHISAVL